VPGIEIVPRPDQGSLPAEGFGRRRVFETETVRVGETRVAPGASSPWHHHGTRTLYGFVAAGQLTLEFGPGGRDEACPSAGEFFRIPPGLIHRDVNHGRIEAAIVNVILGEGPATINVDGPEA